MKGLRFHFGLALSRNCPSSKVSMCARGERLVDLSFARYLSSRCESLTRSRIPLIGLQKTWRGSDATHPVAPLHSKGYIINIYAVMFMVALGGCVRIKNKRRLVRKIGDVSDF